MSGDSELPFPVLLIDGPLHCISGILGLTSTGDGSCTHAAVGYTLDPTVFGVNVPFSRQLDRERGSQ